MNKAKKENDHVRSMILDTYEELRSIGAYFKKESGIPVYVLFVLSLLFCTVAFYYADITVTSRFGLTFLDSLVDGKPFSFYQNALDYGIAPEGAVYDIGTYVVFGIWSLPIWLLRNICGLEPLCIGSLLWYKLLVVILYGISIVQVRKLSLLSGLSEEDSYKSAIIYMLSLSSFFPIFIAVQYDIIAVVLMLGGVIAYFNDKNKLFILLFGLSMTIKPMTIIVFPLLIIIKEKNIFKILCSAVCGVIPLLICKLLYFTNAAYKASAGEFQKGSLGSIFATQFKTTLGVISVFMAAAAVIYVAAYIADVSENRNVILYIYLIWASFCVFGGMTLYWSIYMTPFMVICAMQSRFSRNRVLLVDIAANAALLAVYIFRYPWVYGGDKSFSYLVLKPFCKDVLSGNNGTTVAGILRRVGLEAYTGTFNAIVVVCLFGIAYCAYKSFSVQKETMVVSADPDSEEIGFKWNVTVRVLIIALWIAINLVALEITNMGL